MPEYIRWQWLWESRIRVIVFGLALMALGGFLLAYAILVMWPRPSHRRLYGVLFLAVFLIVSGGYQVLKGLLSPASAFGGYDTSDVYARRKLKRKLKQKADQENQEAVSYEDELQEQADVPRKTRCPACEVRVTVPAGHPPNRKVECPKCLERFVPE
jgi:hypothetical protein